MMLVLRPGVTLVMELCAYYSKMRMRTCKRPHGMRNGGDIEKGTPVEVPAHPTTPRKIAHTSIAMGVEKKSILTPNITRVTPGPKTDVIFLGPLQHC